MPTDLLSEHDPNDLLADDNLERLKPKQRMLELEAEATQNAEDTDLKRRKLEALADARSRMEEAEGDNRPTHGSIIDPIRQGITLGFADEARAGLKGAIEYTKGNDFWEAYGKQLERERALNADYRERHPNLSTAAEVGGAIAGAVPTTLLTGGAGVAPHPVGDFNSWRKRRIRSGTDTCDRRRYYRDRRHHSAPTWDRCPRGRAELYIYCGKEMEMWPGSHFGHSGSYQKPRGFM